MTCINCDNPAEFLFKAPGVDDQPYCDSHLPAPYRNTEWVQAAPSQDRQLITAISDEEPLMEVSETKEDKADTKADAAPEAVAKDSSEK